MERPFLIPMMEETEIMAKLNVSIDDRLKEELFKLVPPRSRSEVVNDALRKELLSHKRRQATDTLRQLRPRTATLTEKDIVESVRKDRARDRR